MKYAIWSALRHRAVYVAVFVALAATALSACAPPTRQNVGYHGPLPPQGVYEECPPRLGSLCLTRLKQIADAGFELVLNYNLLSGNAAKVLAYVYKAHSLGIEVIWPLNNPVFWDGTDLRQHFSELAESCRCSNNAGFISYVVDLAKGVPATWGYYVGDELPSSQHSKMKPYADLLKRLDPSHRQLFVSSESASSRGSNLAPFADTADVIGADYYPVGDSQPIAATGDVARSIQAIANRYHKQSMMVLQAFSFGLIEGRTPKCFPRPSCARFPTSDEMRQMRDLVLMNSHPQLILWYSLHDISRSGDPSLYWANLVAAAGVHPRPSAIIRDGSV